MPSFEFEFGGFKQLDSSSNEKNAQKVETVSKKCPHCGRLITETRVRRYPKTVGKLCKNVFKDDD